jgi:hypothetical protein
MEAPYQAAPDVHVLPTFLPIPGVGVLGINAFVLHAQEPVLIDTGLAMDRDEFLAAVDSIVPLNELRWVWLTHDDADHTGNIEQVLERAPNAKLVTNGLGAMRMASWWPVPLNRVHAIRPGNELNVGDRTLRAVRPPLYDNPMSTGILDTSTGALFSVDSFGAILPEAAESTSEIPDDALSAGMVAWASFDSPWTQMVDRQQFGSVLDDVVRMQPSTILSSHLPAAGGHCTDRFIELLGTLPDVEPFLAPDHEDFGHMVAALAAMTGP